MFARSVSPLKKEWIRIVSEDLFAELMESDYKKQGRKKETKSEPKKDGSSENRIMIGGKHFNLKNWKNGKKIVELPWHELKPVIKNINVDNISRFRKLRGKVLLEQGDFLSGVKLSMIIRVCTLIDPQASITDRMPAAFFIGEGADVEKALAGIDKILHLFRRTKKKKQFGFITLHTDGNGSYWYTSAAAFTASLEESLSSLEVLADELPDGTAVSKIGKTYRRLNELLESE